MLLFVASWGVAAAFGYVMLRKGVTEDILRERFREVVEKDYAALQARYNEAVRNTAVTELVVAGGKLSVRVRNAEGVIDEVATPFDPSGEIYVDYVVIDGRLWIRRVFDESTPPSRGVVINPAMANIDWERIDREEGAGPEGRVSHGQTIYRSIGEGRWVISVSGNGALGLSRIGEDRLVTLGDGAAVRSYDEIVKTIDAEIAEVTVVDVLRRLVSGG